MTSVKSLVLLGLFAGVLCLAVEAVRDQSFYSDYYYPQEEYIVKKKPLREHEKPQDFSKIPGAPGVDFPIFHSVPDTHFSCANVPVHPGMYANVETGCQAYHICHDGREGHQGASFLCTNGTIFNQEIFGCDWWYNVDCSHATALYSLNADPEKNPFTPKKKPEEEKKPYYQEDYYN